MKNIKLIKNNTVITDNAQLADTFFERFRGLMLRKSIADDYALVIAPCNQIHMFNMRFPIDAVYLSESGEVLKTEENIQPWKVCKKVENAVCVIEMNSFASSRLGIAVGDIIRRDYCEKE